MEKEMIPVAFAWRVFLALVKAAIHIHAHDIIHRDLKTENILFMDDAPIEKVEDEKKEREKPKETENAEVEAESEEGDEEKLNNEDQNELDNEDEDEDEDRISNRSEKSDGQSDQSTERDEDEEEKVMEGWELKPIIADSDPQGLSS